MRILNEAYVFHRDAPHDARAAFGSPHKKNYSTRAWNSFVLSLRRVRGPGTREIRSSAARGGFRRRPFGGSLLTRTREGLGIGAIAHIDLAVPKEFNARMEWISVIYLTQPVYAWSGKGARQLDAAQANTYLGGGGEQIFLPNLAANPLATTGQYARMRFFGMCPEYF